jgi:hypothetical protein
MWQLINLKTNEKLSEPGPLPNNWGPVFGMHNIKDQLGDLSWLGNEYADQAWVQVAEEPVQEAAPINKAAAAWERAKILLRESDWAMLSDVPMLNEERARWVEYRAKLRNIRSSVGFPENIAWPNKPE